MCTKLMIFDILINKWIDSKARVLHISSDYGQLDVLLSLQHSQRKIDSFIANDLNLPLSMTCKKDFRYLSHIIIIQLSSFKLSPYNSIINFRYSNYFYIIL